MDTKFKYKGQPVIITGGAFDTPSWMTKPVVIQCRITYQNGDTGYVSFIELEILDNSVKFKSI